MKISYKISKKTVEICDIKYIKNFLRISHDYDDELIVNLLNTAIGYAEQTIGIKIIESNVTANITNSRQLIRLRYGHITKFKSVHLVSNNNKIDITNDFGEIKYKFNEIKLDPKYINQSLLITYVAGYNSNNIPNDIKHGIMVHIARMYEQPENISLANEHVKEFYRPHRIIKI